MKKIALIAVICAFVAMPASADMWKIDRLTALTFTQSAVTVGYPTANTLSVYDGPLTKVFGTGPNVYGPMKMQVGFSGGLAGDVEEPPFGGTALMEIYNSNIALADDGVDYEGIRVDIANDNQSRWSFQLFYVENSNEHSSAWVELNGNGASTVLTASQAGALELDDITTIGIRVKGENMGGPDPSYPSYSDDFHVSIVPVPGAVLLGVLGLSVAGARLRKRS